MQRYAAKHLIQLISYDSRYKAARKINRRRRDPQREISRQFSMSVYQDKCLLAKLLKEQEKSIKEKYKK